MNFKLNNIILVTFASAFVSSNLLDGVDATLQQQQLRGRKLDAPAFCPQLAPANGSSCWGDLPRGWAYGDCDWYKSSWDSSGKSITEHDYCICRRHVDNWQCTKDIETKTSATAASSPLVIALGTTSPSPQQQQGTRKVTASTVARNKMETTSTATNNSTEPISQSPYGPNNDDTTLYYTGTDDVGDMDPREAAATDPFPTFAPPPAVAPTEAPIEAPLPAPPTDAQAPPTAIASPGGAVVDPAPPIDGKKDPLDARDEVISASSSVTRICSLVATAVAAVGVVAVL